MFVRGEGFATTGFDIDAAKVKALNTGRSCIKHIPAKRIAALRKAKNFSTTDDFAQCHREPDLQVIVKAGEEIAPHLRTGQQRGRRARYGLVQRALFGTPGTQQ
jgi:UDP-N-acetyl-D-glucosamine dehydrogenase